MMLNFITIRGISVTWENLLEIIPVQLKVEKKVDYDLSIESITKDMLITMFMSA